jgi:hypothetical protein
MRRRSRITKAEVDEKEEEKSGESRMRRNAQGEGETWHSDIATKSEKPYFVQYVCNRGF